MCQIVRSGALTELHGLDRTDTFPIQIDAFKYPRTHVLVWSDKNPSGWK